MFTKQIVVSFTLSAVNKLYKDSSFIEVLFIFKINTCPDLLLTLFLLNVIKCFPASFYPFTNVLIFLPVKSLREQVILCRCSTIFE